MIADIKQVVKNCEICQLSKISTNIKTPLHPLPVPNRPFALVSLDHEKLSRKTEQNNTFILTFICHFSNYVIFAPVPDETAYTTALFFVKEVIARHGRPEILLSDKGSGFMSVFFQTISKLLGVRHRTSAVHSSKTNGLAENAIKRLNQLIMVYSNDEIDDRQIELILPIIKLSLRATPITNLGVSPYDILHWVPMITPVPCEHNIPVFYSSDAQSYAKWLKTAVAELH